MKMDYEKSQKNLSKFPKLEMMHTKLFCIIFNKCKSRSNSYFCVTFWNLCIKQTESHVEKSQIHEELQAEKHDIQKNSNNENILIRLYEVKWQLLSCVWLFATLWIIQSMEFSKPECSSG